jgi:hypothetical protein
MEKLSWTGFLSLTKQKINELFWMKRGKEYKVIGIGSGSRRRVNPF